MPKLTYVLTALIALVCAALAPAVHAQFADKKVLNLDGARKIAAAAEAEALKNKWNVVIAVVDDGGHLLYLQRMDGTQTGSIDVAIGKARTAMAFKRPTKVFDELAKTRPAILTLGDVTLLEGGVSGVTSVQDAQVAEAGIAALGAQ
jgi:uncharacterized protein GlcG (DUF336 family)